MKRVGQAWEYVLLAAVVTVAYGNSLDGSFQYDDYHSIVRNAALRDVGNIPAFLVDPSLFSADPHKAMYRPVLLMSYTLNHALHGYDVRGYHLVNACLHLLCAVLLWRLARRLSPHGVALAAAALFAAHPVATEPVNYISSRSELLLAVFFLAALWAHVRAWERPGHSEPLSGSRWLAVVCCLLALLSKATAVMLPAVLLLLDVVVLSWRPAGIGAAMRRHGLYWLLSAAYVVVIVLNGYLGGSLAAPVRDAATQLCTQAKAMAWYLRLLVVPTPLSVDHAFTESSAAGAGVVAGALLVASVLWLAARSWRRWPVPAFGLCMAALVLLPTTLMPLHVLVNERRLYLVLAALCLALAALSRLRPRVVVVATAILVLMTVERNHAWATQSSLWESALHNGSQSYRTWVNLGKAYHEQNKVDKARSAYETALRLDDRHGDVYNNMAVLLHQSGRVDEAIGWYQQALQRYPDMDEIYQNLADAHAQLGDHDAAVQVYQDALVLAPDNGAVWNNLGQAQMSRRQYAEAVRAFERAAQLLPAQHEPLNNLGNALDAQGQRGAAIAAYRKGLSLATDAAARATMLANLGETLRRTGENAAAAAALDSALYLAPTASAFDYRARVAFATGQLHEAQRLWTRAVALDPARGSAWTGLGEVLLQQGDREGGITSLRRATATGGGARAWWSLAQALAGGPDSVATRAATRAAYEQVIAHSAPTDARAVEARRWLQRGAGL